MMRNLVASAIVLAAVPLAHAAEPAPAAGPAPAPIETRYVMTLDGKPVAHEHARLEMTPSGSKLTGAVRFDAGGSLSQTFEVGKDGTVASYRLDIDVPNQQIVLTVVPADGGFTEAITPKGAPEPAQTRSIAAASPTVLLDNNFGSHIDLFTRTLGDLALGQERALTVLVPQVAQAISGKVVRLPDGSGTLDGRPVAARLYRVTVANIAMELAARASDGALLAVNVPVQKLAITREGFKPQAPAAAAGPPPDPREKTTTVAGPAGGLPATLLVPKSDKPLPGVVFLSGSGPNDRDETIGPNKPFLEIARALGDRGIASLRFDKRTYALKAKAEATLAAEYYEDGAAAIKLLATTPGVDPKRIFLVGHSEGAMVAPRLAEKAGGVRGLVLMAPGVRPIDAMLIDQMATAAKEVGRSDEEIADQSELLKEKFDAIKDPSRKNTPDFMGAPAAYWREVIALDVAGAVKKSKLPVLVLQGDKDIQVRKDLDFEALRKAVGEDGGRVTYRSFPSLNHLFMRVEGRSSGAEYGIPGKVDPAVTEAVADWIAAH